MARVLITGSSEGLGLMAGQLLIADGHEVVLHARNPGRAADTRAGAPGAAEVLVGDFGELAGVRAVAEQAERSGRFDAVIHNAGVYNRGERRESAEGHELHFAVNVLAAYLLVATMRRPDRLVFLSSGMHRSGTPDLDDVDWTRRRWSGSQAYSDSKLFDVVLSNAVARRWPEVRSNAVEPGWVATRMGGPGASDDLAAAPVTQAWLAVSADTDAAVSGGYWFHQRRVDAHPATASTDLQDDLVDLCASLTGAVL